MNASTSTNVNIRVSTSANWEPFLKKGSPDPTLQTLWNLPGDAFSILQLRFGVETSGLHFMPMSRLIKNGVVPEFRNYEVIYTAPLPFFRNRTEAAERIYARFRCGLPDNFLGHIVVVSDVIVLKMDGFLTAHYVDPNGFQGLDDFLPAPVPAPERR